MQSEVQANFTDKLSLREVCITVLYYCIPTGPFCPRLYRFYLKSISVLNQCETRPASCAQGESMHVHTWKVSVRDGGSCMAYAHAISGMWGVQALVWM